MDVEIDVGIDVESSAIPIPLEVRVDAEHGGRWTSLRGGGREWLWHREEPRRAQVGFGDAFADAGGLEECIPTVRGTPDHGEAWSRAWTALDDTGFEDATGSEGGTALEHVTGFEHVVRCTDFELTRRIRVREGAVVADYRIAATPGYRFVWAGHALLDVSGNATLRLDQGARVRVFPEAAPCLAEPWPPGAAWIEGDWPEPHGLRLTSLGPDDGTAVGAVAYRTGTSGGASLAASASALVTDGPDLLRLHLEAEGQPAAVALWRNLSGFPQPGPYRSIGVEPMLGRVFDLADARDGDCAVVPAAGEAHWRMTITAYRHKEGNENHGHSCPVA